MAFKFTAREFRKLSKILGAPAKAKGNTIRFELEGKERRKLSLEIYPDLTIGHRRGNLISVYTPSAHLQLHFCSGCIWLVSLQI